MPIAIPLWPATRMRVMALEFDSLQLEPSGCLAIREIARIDIGTHPALGFGSTALMSQRYDLSEAATHQRLESAIWEPCAPDILVAAHPDTRAAIPADVKVGELPWIFIFRAWPRLLPKAPSILLEDCWNRGMEIPTRENGGSRPEREAWFASLLLGLLLIHAPPEELVALSRHSEDDRAVEP